MNTVAILPQLVMRLLQTQNVKRNMLTTVTSQSQPISPSNKPDIDTLAPSTLEPATLEPAPSTLAPEAVGSEPFGDALPRSALETTAL